MSIVYYLQNGHTLHSLTLHLICHLAFMLQQFHIYAVQNFKFLSNLFVRRRNTWPICSTLLLVAVHILVEISNALHIEIRLPLSAFVYIINIYTDHRVHTMCIQYTTVSNLMCLCTYVCVSVCVF